MKDTDQADPLLTLATTTVSDALDRLGIGGQCLGIKPLDLGFRLCGRAFTVRMTPAAAQPGSVGDFVDDVPPGQVVVIDNGARPDATVWGDILTLVAHRRGLGGTVIDGHCRDVGRSLELRYPVFSRGWSMRTGKDRVQLEALDTAVSIGGARVQPADLVLGDADGVVVLPASREQEIISLSLEIQAAEDEIRRAVLGGLRLDEARRRFKYFQLQRPNRSS